MLISATGLRAWVADGRPVTLLDVRWRLDQPDGYSAYLDGHLPGAVYVSLDDDLSDHSVPGRGRHPLPSGRSVEAAARRWGIRHGVPTVVYDDWNRAGSARAWWVLTAAGLRDVAILDGGLPAWRAAGGPLVTRVDEPPAGDVTVEYDDLYRGALPTLTAEQVGDFDLLDARARERFRGDVEPLDPVAGHIPGAVNLPSGAVLDADGSFRSGDDIDRLLGDLGLGDGKLGVYCGSGVTAAITVAALAGAGHRAALFPGSWSQWSSVGTNPVARGEG